MDFTVLKPFIPWAIGVWAFLGVLDFTAKVINRKASEELLNSQRKLIEVQDRRIELLELQLRSR